MSSPPIQVLLVEDNAGDARLLREMLKESGTFKSQLTHFACMKDALDHLATNVANIVLLDLGLPDANGVGAVRQVHEVAPRVPLVVLTGLDDEAVATKALQEGAQDYLIKGKIEAASLARSLRYAIERQRMQVETEQVRRLQLQLRDEFISTVSHELRTPLTSLRASLGLIYSGTLDKRPEKQRQMLEMAIGNNDRLIRLVNDILDFEKVEKGKLSFDRQPVEAVDLLRRAADVAENAASLMRIDVRVEAASAQVLADEERILQVLNELVVNAIKFSPPGTTICLSAQPCQGSEEGSAEVCFTVEDQGRGIVLEKLDRIFERFQQGDASDSRALGGTGLGLALCRSIVEQHGGRIWAESIPGKGSRFHFTLPAATAGSL